MNVLIAGDPRRGKQWEKYLRKRPSVRQVIVTSEFRDEPTDAVVLLDDSSEKLIKVLHIIHKGIPVYLVSHLTTDLHALQKIYHASEEANVSVQFSHWSSFSSLTRWIKMNLDSAPRYIEIRKHERGRTIPVQEHYRQTWLDELAYIITLQKSSVQQLYAHPVQLQNQKAGIHVSLRFDDGSVASVQYLGVSSANTHERLIQSDTSFFICDALNHTATRYSSADHVKLLKTEHQTFDSSSTAENSLVYFLRSVKTYKTSGFSAADALHTARLAHKIDNLLKRA